MKREIKRKEHYEQKQTGKRRKTVVNGEFLEYSKRVKYDAREDTQESGGVGQTTVSKAPQQSCYFMWTEGAKLAEMQSKQITS